MNIPREPTIASQAFATVSGVNQRMWSHDQTGWGASLIVHLIGLGALAWCGFSLPVIHETTMLDTRWSPESEPLDQPVLEEVLPVVFLAESGGQGLVDQGPVSQGLEQPEDTVTAVELPMPVDRSVPLTETLSAPALAGDLFAPVALRKPARGSGKGKGTGAGIGAGTGFFGIPGSTSRRIVYVVDNSTSMNHPHDSPAKTRFKRVKMELVQSIWQLQPGQEFFVIFFNSSLLAMPAQNMQPATWTAKQHYLTWVAETKAEGSPTDPRQAMELALRLQPDLVYFLTDGEFYREINRHLLKIRQARTVIHTFSFGEEASQEVLTDIAKNNQGQYTYIP